MIPSAQYPAKILLFGEYSILSGSEALAFPYNKYSGTLKYDCISGKSISDPQKSQRPLIKLFQYLSEHPELFGSEKPDTDRLRNDLISGLYFDSNIPENYGLGSSGAISAAVYDSYCDQTKQKPIDQVIETLSKIESFYHLYSSGIDPLVSFTGQPIHVVNHIPSITDTSLSWIQDKVSVFLIDSGQKGDTKTGVEKKTGKKTDQTYIDLNNKIIRSILRKNAESLLPDIIDLCGRQIAIFADLFTPEVLKLAQQALADKNWGIKLCGSGGGGFYFLFTREKSVPKAIRDSGLSVSPL